MGQGKYLTIHVMLIQQKNGNVNPQGNKSPFNNIKVKMFKLYCCESNTDSV